MRLVSALVLLAHVAVVSGAAAQPAKTPRLDANGDPLPDGAIARLGTLRFQVTKDSSDALIRFTGVVNALSPDGTVVATCGRHDGTRIDFMDTSTGKSLRKLDVADISGDKMQFTPDGKGLVFSGWSAITLVDAVTGKVARSIDVADVRGPVALTSDGKWVATQPQKYVYDAPVGIWETTTGKEVVTLPGRGSMCSGLAFGPAGKRLLLSSTIPTSADGKSMQLSNDAKAALVCIDIKTRKIVGEITVGYIQHIALCPDGETVAVEDPDHTRVRIRHLPTGGERCVIPVKQPKFAFAPDGKVLLTIDDNGRAALWDAAKGDKMRDLEGALANKDYKILGISNDGRTVAVLDGGWQSAATVIVWNAATGKRAGRPPGHEGAVTCLAYAPGGKFLASGSIDRTVRLWNPATGEHRRQLAVHSEAITALAFSPDGKLLASSSKDGMIRLSNIAGGEVVTDFAGPDRGAKALAFSPEGRVLFAGGNSPEVLAWELAGAKEIVRLNTGADGCVMAFADGGALALTANGEIRADETPERLQVWNPSSQQPLVDIRIRSDNKDDHGQVRCDAALFSPDGRLLASSQISEYQGIRPSYGAALLRLWERASGQPILTVAPTVTTVLAFSPNGRLLAGGGTGTSGHLRVGYGSGIDVWDAVTGRKAGSLPVTPQCLAFSPDGLQVATGGRDHGILIWEAPRIQPPKNAKAPSAALRDAWWPALGGHAKDAYKAIGEMLDTPEHAVALLKERVPPVRPGDPGTVAKLIVQLDSETYAVRVKVQTALETMGEGAAHLIKQALEGKVSEELRRRLEGLLRKCDATSTLGMQHHRAVATLEWIGTPAARALLRTLADGAPRARLTVEAHAALKRLQG